MSDIGFENQLMSYMLHRRHDKIEWMLKHQLKNTQCDFGKLLRNAAMLNNVAVARHLLELGTEIDCPDQHGRTPLMIAVLCRSAKVFKILLEADADTHRVDAHGESVLRMVLHSINNVPPHFDPLFNVVERLQILVAFFQSVKSQKTNAEELLRAGYSLFHVAFSNDVQLLERMLKQGVNIDSAGFRGMTALHAAVGINEFSVARWLLQKGANVNAKDEDGRTPLFVAASSCNKSMMQLLLERGADPNVEDYQTGSTTLYGIFSSVLSAMYRGTLDISQERMDDCIELLLQHGAIPRISAKLSETIFDYALSMEKRPDAIYYVIARLATLKSSITKNVMRWSTDWPREECVKLDNYFEHCKRILNIIMFEKLSLCDLLTIGEHKLKLLVRNKTFVREVQKVCSKQRLETLCLFYFKTLTKRISNAADIVTLEDQATKVISKMFEGNYNLCYDFGRKVVGYLNKHELEQLCLVYE